MRVTSHCYPGQRLTARFESCSWSVPHLLHVKRTDGGDVIDAGLADHRLGELHLRCDVGHLHRVVVVVGDVQSVLQGAPGYERMRESQWLSAQPISFYQMAHVRPGQVEDNNEFTAWSRQKQQAIAELDCIFYCGSFQQSWRRNYSLMYPTVIVKIQSVCLNQA